MGDLAADHRGNLVHVPRVRADDVEVVRRNAEAAQQRLHAGRRDERWLTTGHADHLVVEDEQRHVGVVRHRVEQGRDPRVHEGAVADDGDDRPEACVGGALGEPDRRPHADAGLHCVERRQRAERVAADVGGHQCRPGVPERRI